MNKVFMAFASGNKSVDEVEIKRYIGIAPVYVLAVNPNKAELEKLYNTTIDKEPEYLGEVEVDGNKIPNVRIDFIVKTDAPRSNNIDFTSKVSFFIRKEYCYNRDKSKVQVIDKYGETAWVTVEQAKNKEIPVYSNGPAKIDKDYRPCFRGEENLIKFIRTYLGIPRVYTYNREDNSWNMRSNPSESEGRLDKILDYFNGDFSELKSIIALQKENKIKVMFGVRKTDDGKMYQTVFTEEFASNNTKNYNNIDKELQNRLSNGAYSTTEFCVCDLKEYVVEATDFTSTNTNKGSEDSTPWF